MKLHIKNMVCNRCIIVVKSILEEMDLNVQDVELGEVNVEESLNEDQKKKLNQKLNSVGFELIDNKKSRQIEKIKNLIIELVHRQNGDLQINLSDYLSQQLNQEYNYLSHLFSEVEGSSIEKFYIAQKIERVKELLVYDELNLSEISYQLHYSSVSHLSNQFKKVTGLSPSHFKKVKQQKRKSLDQL